MAEGGQHLAIHNNAIMSRITDATSTALTGTAILYLNQDGGRVQVGTGGLNVVDVTDTSGGATTAV
jgi:hypothetical protein